MKHAKSHSHRRVKAVGIAAAALVVGIGLLVLSHMVIVSGRKAAAEAAAQSQPAPATAPATAPAGTPAPEGTAPGTPGEVPPLNKKAASAQHFGGLLLLFSLMSFAVTVIAVGWIIYDIRRSRPAWKRQTKYPVRHPPK